MSPDPVSTIARDRRFSRALWLLTAMILPTPVRGQDHSAPVVEVFLTQSVTIPFAGVSHVLVVDDRICQVSIDAGVLTVLGLARGETVVLVWRTEDPESLVVRVESPPVAPVDSRSNASDRTPRMRSSFPRATSGPLAATITTLPRLPGGTYRSME